MSKKVRPVTIEGDIAYVPLTKGHVAVIDATDAASVSQYNWQALVFDHTVYAKRSTRRDENGKQKAIFLHRHLLTALEGMEIDHIDNDGLNNRRANLRHVSRSENMMNARMRKSNRSGFKGVFWHKSTGHWRAKIVRDGIAIELGSFPTAEAGHAAYVEASKKYHGEFGRTK